MHYYAFVGICLSLIKRKILVIIDFEIYTKFRQKVKVKG